ncbi:MAG TPA: hypothetical protein PLA94_10635, partial [Myxococcota bacterium]|nr:hypothetical protein [Myxococcota bacterium]
MSTLDAWVELRHGSQLLDRNALERLPAPLPPPPLLAEHLRTALRAYENTEDLGPLLDVVLEEGLGLRVGWHKNLGAADGEKLLDGTILKPRRRWGGAFGESFLLFTTEEARIGLHRGRRIVAQVTEYLRRRQLSLALLTNGQQWRLIYADRDSTGWVEWDRERWLEAERLTEPFLLFRHLLSIQSLAAPAANKVPALIQGIRDTRKGQSKLSAVLGENVRRAVELLLVSRRSRVEEQWSAHRSRDLYVAACHFIMRLVVLLFAEARELLPVDRPLYHQGYGLRGLLEQLDKSGAERRRHRYSAWFRLIALFRLIHKGSAHPALVLTAYGGELFGPGAAESADPLSRALACLEQTTEPPSDEQLYQMFLLLTRTSQRVREGLHTKTVPVPIDFSDLTSEYIGILYEGLLDYELHRAGAEPVLFLNLGDQPALPLDRLERMEDKAIAVLLAEAGKAGKEEEEDAESEEGPAEEASTTDITSEEEVTSDSEVTSESEVSSEEPDDLRERARSRANAWARRAVVAAGLVKKSRKNDDALDSAARNLVPHQNIKLPGDLYLVRWGGTRKGAGTFYTRPQLTHPTVRRTLEPLLFEEGRIRPPEAILSLKICDPAMGSGSFLVAALRVLTDAVIEALHHHGRVHRSGDLLRLSCDLIPAENQAITEDRLPGIVRRAVVEHCLYGVDLDPLAVELARVALWVETMDRRLPFTFLDHKLRCGNALVGCWFDRFRDYPLLAWNRQSPDEKWRGVHHPADFWSAALKNRRSEVASEQAQLLSGQERLSFAATADAELRAAIERL